MQIGITGASGLLGRALIAEANRREIDVVAYTRKPEQAIPGAGEVRVFHDPAEADYRGLNALFHLAGEPLAGLWTEAKKNKIRSSRVEGTAAVVRGLERLGPEARPKTLINASAVGFYGDAGNGMVDEDGDPGFGYLAEVVRKWEKAASGAESLGIRVALGRLGVVLGPTGGVLPFLSQVFRAFLGGRLGSGTQWMSWVHIDDAARMFFHCLENKGIAGPVNFTSPHPVTNAEFTKTLAAALNRPALLPVPAFVLRAAPGGMEELFLNSQRVDPGILRIEGFSWKFPDLGPALENALRVQHYDGGEKG